MNSKVIYISGPMTGYPKFNFPAFFEAERILREVYPDSYIINPAAIDKLRGFDYENKNQLCHEELLVLRRDCIGRDFMLILGNTPDIRVKETCLIVLLEGYLASNGANLELDLCRYLGWDLTSITKFIE